MIQKTKIIDTIATIKYDSTVVAKNNLKQIILVKEHQIAKDKDWYESTILTSFIYPALVALIVLYVTRALNKKKNKSEQKKLTEEIDKVRVETENMKKSFQPIVISTLQSIQDEIIPSKIDALKKLVALKNDFAFFEQQFCEGDPVVPNLEEFLRLLYFNFGYIKLNDFKKYHDEYSYLFPNNVFKILKNLKTELSILDGNKKSFNSIYDGDMEPSKRDINHIKKTIDLYDEAILAIRKDCHLDTSFIHEFIEENK